MSSSKNLEFKKTGFLINLIVHLLNKCIYSTLIKIQIYQDSWKNYFDEIGEEIDIIVNEINGPSWSPKKNKISLKNVQEISKKK